MAASVDLHVPVAGGLLSEAWLSEASVARERTTRESRVGQRYCSDQGRLGGSECSGHGWQRGEDFLVTC